jgi:hypothetical protein
MDEITAAIPSLQDIHDVLPVPDTLSPITDPNAQEIATSMSEEPTLSHELAMQDHEHKGAAQKDHDVEEVANLGWNVKAEEVASPLVGGMKNDNVWILVRRFNQQMYHLKEETTPPPGKLDLNIADEEEFSPDKLRSNIERLYMTVVCVGLVGIVE